MSAHTLTPVVSRIEHADGPIRPLAASYRGATSTSDAGATSGTAKAKSGLGFSDFLDTINPLQQLPIIGSIYRAVTGDEISSQAHYAGSALYGMALGGPIGMGAMVGLAIAEDVVSDHFSSPDVAVAASEADESPNAQLKTAALPLDKPVSSVAPTGAEEVAVATVDGTPLDLFQWLRPEAATAGYSIETVSEPFAPVSVNDVAAHPNNHLPLGVLETLRQRHMGLLDDEQA